MYSVNIILWVVCIVKNIVDVCNNITVQSVLNTLCRGGSVSGNSRGKTIRLSRYIDTLHFIGIRVPTCCRWLLLQNVPKMFDF